MLVISVKLKVFLLWMININGTFSWFPFIVNEEIWLKTHFSDYTKYLKISQNVVFFITGHKIT